MEKQDKITIDEIAMSRRLETLFKYSHIKIKVGSSLWQTAHLKSISVHRQVRKKKKT